MALSSDRTSGHEPMDHTSQFIHQQCIVGITWNNFRPIFFFFFLFGSREVQVWHEPFNSGEEDVMRVRIMILSILPRDMTELLTINVCIRP